MEKKPYWRCLFVHVSAQPKSVLDALLLIRSPTNSSCESVCFVQSFQAKKGHRISMEEKTPLIDKTMVTVYLY